MGNAAISEINMTQEELDKGLLWACWADHLELVKLLLEKGANIHVENNLSLRYASYNGHLEIVLLLLEKGADVRAYDDSALRLASCYNHIEIVKVLKEHIKKVNQGEVNEKN